MKIGKQGSKEKFYIKNLTSHPFNNIDEENLLKKSRFFLGEKLNHIIMI
jgi:hypothetical protein